MERTLRLATAIVLGLGGLASLGLGIYLLAVGGASFTGEELRSWSPVHRSMFALAHTRYGGVFAGAFVVAALVAGGLAVVLVRGRARWPLIVIAAAAVGLVLFAQWSKGDIESSEPRGYRDRSPYVAAARALASSVSIYGLALIVLAGAAWWLSRPKPPAAPPA